MNENKKPQSIIYQGRLSDYQLHGDFMSRYVDYEKDPFSPYQNFLYKRALFGLAVYSPDELKHMHSGKRKRIIKVHERTQNVLNLWKQDLCNKMVNSLYNEIFYHSSLIKDLVENFSEIDPQIKSKVDFKGLGISKREIVNKLISEKVLPVDFYNM